MDERNIERLLFKIGEQNAPAPDLAERTLKKLRERRSPRRAWRLVAQTALAAVLVATISVTALAAAVPSFRAWLFGPDSELGKSLGEVTAVGEAQGVRMEVLGTMGSRGSVVAYFTLCDTFSQGRLAGDISVNAEAELYFDVGEGLKARSYSFEERTEALSYDTQTQTLLCRYSLNLGNSWIGEDAEAMQGYDATDASITLSVKSISQNAKSEFEVIPVSALEMTQEVEEISAARESYLFYGEDDSKPFEYDYLTVEEAKRLAERWKNNYISQYLSSYSFWHFLDENETPVVLAVSEQEQAAGLYSAGFINGELHVRTEYGAKPAQESLTNVYCVGSGESEELISLLNEGVGGWSATAEEYELLHNRLFCSHTMKITDENEVIWTLKYAADDNRIEYVFDISPEEIDGYELVFQYDSASEYELELTSEEFVLGDAAIEEAVSVSDISAGEIAIDRIRLSPLEVTVIGARESLIQIEELELVCGDEIYPCTLVEGSTGYYARYGEEAPDPQKTVSLQYFIEGVPAELEELTAIKINGIETEIK